MAFLTGLMGSGKSTVGALLAKRLGWRFADTDQLVEARSRRTIYEIFEKQGEAAFRKLESRALRSLKAGKGLVVATGGGIIVNPKNRAWMRRRGVLVYLKLSPAAALRRMKGRGERTRPLLKGGAGALAALARKRARFYAMAGIRVSALGSPAQVCGRIAKKMGLPLSRKSPR
jgi:shikimate kinase